MRDAATLFGIDLSTLRRWCRRLGINPFVLGADHRRRFLSEHDVMKLARAYHRVAIQPDMESLIQKVDQLTRLVQQV